MKDIRLGYVVVSPAAAKKLLEVGKQEKRAMVKQAAYVIEAWAKGVK